MEAAGGWGQREMSARRGCFWPLAENWAPLAKRALPPLPSVDTLRGGLRGTNQSFTTIQTAFFWYLWSEENQPSCVSLLFSKLESSFLCVFFLELILWSGSSQCFSCEPTEGLLGWQDWPLNSKNKTRELAPPFVRWSTSSGMNRAEVVARVSCHVLCAISGWCCCCFI